MAVLTGGGLPGVMGAGDNALSFLSRRVQALALQFGLDLFQRAVLPGGSLQVPGRAVTVVPGMFPLGAGGVPEQPAHSRGIFLGMAQLSGPVGQVDGGQPGVGVAGMLRRKVGGDDGPQPFQGGQAAAEQAMARHEGGWTSSAGFPGVDSFCLEWFQYNFFRRPGQGR